LPLAPSWTANAWGGPTYLGSNRYSDPEGL